MLNEFESKYLEFNLKVCNIEGVDEELLNEILDLMDKIKIKYSKKIISPNILLDFLLIFLNLYWLTHIIMIMKKKGKISLNQQIC